MVYFQGLVFEFMVEGFDALQWVNGGAKLEPNPPRWRPGGSKMEAQWAKMEARRGPNATPRASEKQ